MPKKTIYFDYFRPCSSKNPDLLTDLSPLLELLFNADQESRVMEDTKVHNIRISLILHHKNYQITDGGILQYPIWEVHFTRTRYDIPGIYNSKTHQINPADFDDDEYIAEETSFLYDNEKNIVILQRNKGGASPSSVQRFFNCMLKDKDFIELQPIIKTDSLERAISRNYYSLINIRLNNITDDDMLDDMLSEETSVKKIIDVARLLNSKDTEYHSQVEITFKIPGKNKSRSLENNRSKKILSFLHHLIPTNKIDKLSLMGKVGEEQPFDPVDLINDVIRDKTSINVTEKNRYIPSCAIYNKMAYLYSRRRDQF